MKKDIRRATSQQKQEAVKYAQKIFQEFIASNANKEGNMQVKELQEIQEIVDSIGNGCIKLVADGKDGMIEFLFCAGQKPRTRHTQKKTKGGVYLPNLRQRGIL